MKPFRRDLSRLHPRSTRPSAGSVAEDQGIDHLRRRGYCIEARNVASKAGEVDVVAPDGDTLCFIEVKPGCRTPTGRP